MADTKEKAQQRDSSAQSQPQQAGQKKSGAPHASPQRPPEPRKEQAPAHQGSGKHETGEGQSGKQRWEEEGGKAGQSKPEAEQHKEKHQGQKMPQQNKNDQGNCGCG